MEDTLVIGGNVIAQFTVEGLIGERVKDFDLSFEVETEEQLRLVAGMLGGIERLAGNDRLLTYHPGREPYGRPRTEGGRQVDLHVWLSEELAAKPTPDPPTVLKRLRDEAAALAAEEAAADAAEVAAERATFVGDEEAMLLRGRPVGPSGQPLGSTVSTEPGMEP